MVLTKCPVQNNCLPPLAPNNPPSTFFFSTRALAHETTVFWIMVKELKDACYVLEFSFIKLYSIDFLNFCGSKSLILFLAPTGKLYEPFCLRNKRLVHPIGHGHKLDTRNKPADEFFIVSYSKMGAGSQRSKIGQI